MPFGLPASVAQRREIVRQRTISRQHHQAPIMAQATLTTGGRQRDRFGEIKLMR
jgi:hypothetical protein